MTLAFTKFLKSEYSSENLAFWYSCEEYKKLKNKDDRFKKADCIYEQYIISSSIHQVRTIKILLAYLSVRSEVQNSIIVYIPVYFNVVIYH